MLATSLRRTCFDLAAAGSLAQGVVALDHVLARGTDRATAAGWLSSRRPFRGASRFERALAVATGRSESPLESLSLARIHELGFATPIQQHEVDAGGSRYRLDFFWPDVEVAGEADGAAKYLEPGDLWREKRREDAIRRCVRGFARWSWSDALAGAPLGQILRAAGVPRR